MAFGETRGLNVHSDVLVALRISAAEDFAIWCLVHEKKFATEDTISALEQIVLPVQVLLKLAKAETRGL